MNAVRHIGFGDTPSFKNLYGEVLKNTDTSGRLAYANFDPSLSIPPSDEQKVLLNEYKPTMPILTFIGSEKLHGENMAVCYSNGELWVQGRNHIRTILADQNGMANFVEATKSSWMEIIHSLESLDLIDTTTHTVVLDCEWAGANIQKGNAACSGTNKGAYLFDYYRVVSNTDDKDQELYSTNGIGFEENHIYNLASFGTYSITLDFNNPTKCEEDLKVLAELIEEKSPIAAHFNRPENVGEGVYFYSLATDIHPVYRLKAKGEKHGGKPKQPREQHTVLTQEESDALYYIAEKVTPVWRLTQAITETNSTEMKHVGEVIKWVLADIVKEEMPTLTEEGIELQRIKSSVIFIVKKYYTDYLKPY